uniref:TAF6-like RNA polymerase II p300/CBP-associated factor-associated factor 65 kDa subunit 6L n=1 Tax=Takifugu rubripes TaxID=31033 RepID=H2U5H0_TAKRU
MNDRDERRFAEVSHESVRLMAESAGVELDDDVAALLAEDVCYRLREATQSSSQFMKHAKRRKLTVEDFNRALRWSNVEAIFGCGAQDATPFRSLKDGELFLVEDRDVNLVELALATNIPKGCAETVVRVNVSYLDGKGNLESQGTVPTAVQSLSDELMKYYQQVTRAILGDDPHLMKVALLDLQSNSKIAALLPYFVYVISGVKSVSHDLEQLNRLLHMVKSLVRNPYLYLGSYVRSLVSSVMYCILEPLAASINPLNDHWTLRDYAALLLSHIFWIHGDLVGGLYHQVLLSLQKVLSDPVRPLCSHYGAVVGLHALGWKAVERVLFPHLPAYWANLQAVLDDNSVSNAQVKADGHKVYGAILVAVEQLLKLKALSQPSLSDAASGIASHLQAGGACCPWEEWTPVSLPAMYSELYSFFGDSLAVRFSTGSGFGSCPPCTLFQLNDAKKELPSSASNSETTRKMPQLTANLNISPSQDGSPCPDSQLPSLTARSRSYTSRSGQHSAGPPRDIFPKACFTSNQIGHPGFSFLIGGRQMGRRCQGRRPFQTTFTPTLPFSAIPPRVFAHKLPVIGRVGKPVRHWTRSHYSLHLPL